MELPPTPEAVPDKYNASMSFPSKDTCLIADGAGSIYFVDTSNRSLGDVVSWKVSVSLLYLVFKYQTLNNIQSGIIFSMPITRIEILHELVVYYTTSSCKFSTRVMGQSEKLHLWGKI